VQSLVWLVTVVGLAIGFAVVCLLDLSRGGPVRHLPRWAWAVLCLWTPWGGIIYLVAGKVWPEKPPQICHHPWPHVCARDQDRTGLDQL
jgi:hypothetical protein